MAISASNSKSLYAPSGSSAWTLSISFTEESTSIANNTSSIKITGKLKSSSGSFSSGSSNKLTIYWHDNNTGKDTSWGSTSTSSISSGGSISKSVTKTVTHKSDGTLSGYAKVVWSKNDGNSWTPASGNVSTSTKALTTIPRVSTPTMGASSYTVTASSLPTLVIKTNRASTALSHKASISINGTSYNFNSGNAFTTDTCSWTMTSAARTKLLQTIPSATQYTATVTLTTFSGSTNLGSKTCTVVLKITDSFRPTISAPSSPTKSVEELNSILTSLSGFVDSCVVTNLSKKKVGVVCTANGSSTIAAVTIQNGSKTKSATLTSGVYYAEFTANELSAANFTATVRDSRGYTASISYSGSLVNYVTPSFSSIDIKRVSSTQPETLITIKGNWFNDSIGNITNSINIEYQYAKVFDDQTNYAVNDLAFYGDNVYKCKQAVTGPWNSTKWEVFNTFTSLPKTYGTGSLKNTFTAANNSSSYMTCEYQYNYKVKIRMWDAINGVTYTTIRTLTSAVPVLWIGERTIRVGGAAIMNYLGMPHTNGEKIIDGNLFKEMTDTYGGYLGSVSAGSNQNFTLPDDASYEIIAVSRHKNQTCRWVVIPHLKSTSDANNGCSFQSDGFGWYTGDSTGTSTDIFDFSKGNGNYTWYDSSSKFASSNGFVNCLLVFKSKAAESDTSGHVIGQIPDNYEFLRPQLQQRLVCHGSNQYRFYGVLNTDGTISLDRYGYGGTEIAIPSGAWLNFCCTYVARTHAVLVTFPTNQSNNRIINVKSFNQVIHVFYRRLGVIF